MPYKPRKPRPRSRFRRPTKPTIPTPRYSKGDICGEFEVMEYLGWEKFAPRGYHECVKSLSQEHHWYDVRCMRCAAHEIHTQQQLNDKRRHRMCQSCIQEVTNADQS